MKGIRIRPPGGWVRASGRFGRRRLLLADLLLAPPQVLFPLGEHLLVALPLVADPAQERGVVVGRDGTRPLALGETGAGAPRLRPRRRGAAGREPRDRAEQREEQDD